MKIHAVGNRKAKRAVRLVLEAENEIEEAVLFQKFSEFVANPPALEPWNVKVLNAVTAKPTSVARIGEILEMYGTAINNRLAILYEMGLVKRITDVVPEGGRRWLYSLNLRPEGEPKPNDIVKGDDL
jgi:predicted transcriptional regulator